jgi:CDGSH-type Zn-finger protein
MNSNHPSGPKIEVTRDGPYHVTGSLPLIEQWIALCRGGGSRDKPFCDGSHAA